MPARTQQWRPIGSGAIRAAVEAKRTTPRTEGEQQQQQQSKPKHETTPQFGADKHGPRTQQH
jgi:hypothetical protein